jgi:hypothetical protein
MSVYYCAACGHGNDVLIPVEPVFTLQSAAILLGTSYPGGIRSMLQRYRARLSPPRYKRLNRQCAYRMLTASDVRTLRELTLRAAPVKKAAP